MTPEELEALEARLLSEVNARVAAADAQIAELRASAQKRVDDMIQGAFDRLMKGLAPFPTSPLPTDPPETEPPAGTPAGDPPDPLA